MNVIIAAKDMHIPVAYLAILEPIQEKSLTRVICVRKDLHVLAAYLGIRESTQEKSLIS